MKCLTAALSLALMYSAPALARDAAQLKVDLLSMMPAGKTEMRLAWIKGSGTSAIINKVSSNDGAITKLYGPGKYGTPHVAANGQRVFFMNSATDKLVVINWDGTGFKEVSMGGDVYEYWCNPADGSDWAIVKKNGMSRVKIDATSTVVQVLQQDWAGDGCGLSGDGKWFFAYYDDGGTPPYATFSMFNTPKWNWVRGPHGGCVGSLSAGTPPKYNHNPSGHTQFCIHDGLDQNKFTMYSTTDSIQKLVMAKGQSLSNCFADGGSSPTQEGTRFTNDNNLLSCCASASKVNPFLVRVPDLKMIYIEDGLSCMAAGDLDGAFLPYNNNTGVVNTSLRSGALASGTGASPEVFYIDGRRITPALRSAQRGQGAVHGVVIRRYQGRTTAVQACVD